ncbi:hypothetical protein AB0H42_27950 [Nocardia sp. NPDC050799]
MSHSIAFGWIEYDLTRTPESDGDRWTAACLGPDLVRLRPGR